MSHRRPPQLANIKDQFGDGTLGCREVNSEAFELASKLTQEDWKRVALSSGGEVSGGGKRIAAGIAPTSAHDDGGDGDNNHDRPTRGRSRRVPQAPGVRR